MIFDGNKRLIRNNNNYIIISFKKYNNPISDFKKSFKNFKLSVDAY